MRFQKDFCDLQHKQILLEHVSVAKRNMTIIFKEILYLFGECLYLLKERVYRSSRPDGYCKKGIQACNFIKKDTQT